MLYINEEIINPALTINIMGHQWFWSFDYTDLFPYWFNLVADSLDIDDFVIESYMEPEEFLRTDYPALGYMKRKNRYFYLLEYI